MRTPEAARVRAALEKIATSRFFAGSDRLGRFLRFTVEAKLCGQGDRVKEFVLGRDVFDRDDQYDPRIDPIVRVEARRLRAKLDEYYRGDGASDAVRIEYPKGSYLPVFTDAGAKRAGAAQPNANASVVAMAAALLIAIALPAFGSPSGSPAGIVAVFPSQWLWPNHQGEPSGIDLAQALTAALANRRIAHVVAWPVVSGERAGGKSLRAIASDLHAAKILSVSVRYFAGEQYVAVFVMDPVSGEKLRALRYRLPSASNPDAQNALAERIASDLAHGVPL